jgi:hypothetical protein
VKIKLLCKPKVKSMGTFEMEITWGLNWFPNPNRFNIVCVFKCSCYSPIQVNLLLVATSPFITMMREYVPILLLKKIGYVYSVYTQNS